MEFWFVLVLLVGALVLAGRLWLQRRALLRTYAPIVDAHEEVRRATAEAERLRSTAKSETDRLRAEAAADAHAMRTDAGTEAARLKQSTAAEIEAEREAAASQVAALKRQRAALTAEYGAAHQLYERLRKEVSLLEENVESLSVGLYKPHYTFENAAGYKAALDVIWERQKVLLKEGRAAVSGQQWEIQGDKKAGERMTKQYLKLILRAFNGECDAAIAKVSWNNVTKMEERIRKSYEAINEFGSVMQMRITPEFLDLKVSELRLEHEYAEKKREEQEEQRRLREQAREDERARREVERAIRDAEEEEARNQRAIDRARAELAAARGEALEQLQLKIKHLDAALHKAHERKEQATSMAQLTRSGYVYIISNVGTLGDDVYKIGMTRRLDPMDRIWELSDASVPFDFDVHALVYCEDAPALECAFHDKFRARAVNLVNERKEFFAVTLDEIEAVARERNLQLQLTRLAEAKEYRQTLALREAAAKQAHEAPRQAEELPAAI